MLSIPSSALNILAFECILGFSVPVIFLIVWKKKHKLNLFPFFIGVLTYAVFEQIVVLLLNDAAAKSFADFTSSLVPGGLAYALYAGIATALFGEIGRYISFRFSLNEKSPGVLNSITYGIGHGGAEFIVSLGFNSAFYLLFAASVKNGVDPQILAGTLGGELSAVEATVSAISAIGIGSLILSLTEQLCFFAMHLLLSVITYTGVKKNNPLLPLCSFAVHAAVCIIIMYSPASGKLIIDAVLLAAMAAALYFVFKKERLSEQN